MSFPNPGYLTRRVSAAPSLVLLVFLHCTDANQPQQLVHDRLAIAVPLDANVAQLHSLIEQRYQQLLSDEDDEDGRDVHRIVVRRVYKVAEFAYVVSRHEIVGEVFANEEQVQADVSFRPSRDKQRTEKREEAREEEEKQQSNDEALPASKNGSYASLSSTSQPPRTTSLISLPLHTPPPSYSDRPAHRTQPRTSPTRNQSTSTVQQRHSHDDGNEHHERKEWTAVEEVEGGKKLDKQLAQHFNTVKAAAQPRSQPPDQQRAQVELAEQEQAEDESGTIVGEAKGETDHAAHLAAEQADGSSTALLVVADDSTLDEEPQLSTPRKRKAKKAQAKEGIARTAVQPKVDDDEKQERKEAKEEKEEETSNDTVATPVQPARPSASVVAATPAPPAPAEKKKRGRKRKIADLAVAAPALPAPVASSSSSAASSAATSLSLSAISPTSPLSIAGPSHTRCILCGQGGGILKLTSRSTKATPEWCHQMCATWCDGTHFDWKDHRVYGITTALARAKRKKLQCRLCRQPIGTTAPVQCVEDECDEAFHVTCGVTHGYQTFEAEPDEEAQARGMQEEFVAACPRHNNPKYDEKNDDDCCSCLYTRPSQPEMSGRLTCIECGVRVHRTCYYNLPSDSVDGEQSDAKDGRIDWRRWTCMCCEYQRSGIYYFVDEARHAKEAAKKKAGRKKRAVSDDYTPNNGHRAQAKRNGEKGDGMKTVSADSGLKSRSKRKEQDEQDGAEAEGGESDEERLEAAEETEKAEAEAVEEGDSKGDSNDEEGADTNPPDPVRGKRRTPADTRGSGATNKRQKKRHETFERTGFSNGRAQQNGQLSSQPQDGETDGDVEGRDVADEEKAPSQHQLQVPLMSPVTSRAAAVVHKSPPIPMAKNLDPRRSAAVRRLEENASREKLAAKAASTTPKTAEKGRSVRDEPAARSASTPQAQHQQSSSSSGLIINTLRASTSASLSQPTTPASATSTPASYPRSTLSRKEYSCAVSRYSALSLRAVLHHYGLNYTGTREGLAARLMVNTPQLPSDDERRQWEQSWEKEAGEDKDKEMLRMPDREFERHRQQRQDGTSEPRHTKGWMHGSGSGVLAAVAGFGPAKEVRRLRQSAELAEAVEEERKEEEMVDDMDEEAEDEDEDSVEEDEIDEHNEEDEKLREAIDSIEEVENSSSNSSRSDEDQPEPHSHAGGAPNNVGTAASSRGRGRGRGRGRRGRGAGQLRSKEVGVESAGNGGPTVKQVNGHTNGGGRGRGRGRKRGRGRGRT